MKYEYTYRTTAGDLWQLSMYYIYGSMVGVCNLIFTAAVLALTAARWNLSGSGLRILLVFGCLLFPVLQPLMVYGKARKQARANTMETKIGFDSKGIHVRVGEESSDTGWEKVKRISKKPTMIIVFSDTVHGFVLTNRVLGKQREEFYEYVSSKIKGE